MHFSPIITPRQQGGDELVWDSNLRFSILNYQCSITNSQLPGRRWACMGLQKRRFHLPAAPPGQMETPFRWEESVCLFWALRSSLQEASFWGWIGQHKEILYHCCQVFQFSLNPIAALVTQIWPCKWTGGKLVVEKSPLYRPSQLLLLCSLKVTPLPVAT